MEKSIIKLDESQSKVARIAIAATILPKEKFISFQGYECSHSGVMMESRIMSRVAEMFGMASVKIDLSRYPAFLSELWEVAQHFSIEAPEADLLIKRLESVAAHQISKLNSGSYDGDDGATMGRGQY